MFNDGGSIGPLATINCEPRQARKGAAVTIDSGAGVWLLGLPPNLEYFFIKNTIFMTYIALARKWRPRTFSQLIGQEHINKALSNSLNKNRLHHAYLFTGTRGVGKTSVARLLAKALNCEQGISAEPCLQCDACLSIEQGRFIDLIEVDGASRTRVEDTRELLENIQYVPTSGRFKIYLIDEVHMLSQHSFNALLKTLEEPPAHVKFLLATTDPQKLPLTILSRCLQFNLKHLQADLICDHLEHILEDEQITYDKPALTLLAKAAHGSMRDALSLLDQAIATSDNHLYTQDVKASLGYTQKNYAVQILQALAASVPHELIIISQQIATEGGNFHYVVDEILSYLHQISLTQNIPDNNPLIPQEPEVLVLSAQIPKEDVQLFYQIGIKAIEDMYVAPTLAIGFEMMLLRMYTFRPAPQEALPLGGSAIETTQNSEIPPSILPTLISPVDLSTDLDIVKNNESIQALNQISNRPLNSTETLPLKSGNPRANTHNAKSLDDTITEGDDWCSLLPKLKLTGLALSAAENAEFISKSESQVILRVAKGHQSVFTTAVISRIEQGLSNHYKDVIKLTLISNEQVLSSPAQQRERSQKKMHENSEVALQNDPFFQQLQQEFSAEIVRNSIAPVKDGL